MGAGSKYYVESDRRRSPVQLHPVSLQFVLSTAAFALTLLKTRSLDMTCEAETSKNPDAVVVDIHLIPGKTVAGRHRMSVVVVVPSLPTGQQCYP